MTEKCFVDTNIWIYARDASEPGKRDRAREWLETLARDRLACLSMQVVNEFYAALRSKFAKRISMKQAREETLALLALDPAPLTPSLVSEAWSLQDRFGFSWWDSLIVASARASGSVLLLSEDLQDGLLIDDLRVVDPFKRLPAELMKML